MNVRCFVCGKTEKSAVYLNCIHEDENKLVCSRCLPVLIHGAH